MAEEPQPSTVQEGATEDAPQIPASAEDRKTQAALSSLENRGDDDDSAGKKNVDTEALGKAMQNLDVKDSGAKKPAEPAKKVKIDAADVTLIVSEGVAIDVRGGHGY
jgi:hypothetical protein